MSIALFVNPRSRANRRDPGRAARFAALLGAHGRVIAPTSLEAMADEARALALAPPSVIGIDGGDGTLHQTLTALLAVFADKPLPPVAIVSGGTMNVVASSLGIRVDGEVMVAQLAQRAAAGQTAPVVRRRCLKLGAGYGFVFGNGFMTNFLEEFYTSASYSPARALLMGGRLFGSAFVKGPFSKRVFRPWKGRVTVDGQPLPWRALTGVTAATVREIGFGFKLNHRADEDPDRFSVLAIHAPPLALTLDVLPVRRGQGIAPVRAHAAVASRLVIEPDEVPFSYTIDGDMYEAAGPLEITVGPQLSFVDPR